ncbi:hypothetical protein Dsin_011149 [Dipteronia sinensis]|uniref:GATA-type domain-containing protein n=1 Tax=Dipteronia sinensis TaxID=43782 RepID=A0AAE0EDI6_9ROSI|nr:hypothetical protein Dsin_011149 [Dipteronia sinensis]
MMHRCSSSSQGNMVGPCSCGLFHSQNSCNSSNSYSMMFSMPNQKSFDETDMYPFMSPSSSVDCTLSLGTPSTRLTNEDDENRQRIRHHDQRRSSSSSSCMPNFCWDFLQTRNSPYPPHHQTTTTTTHNKPSRGGGANNPSNNNSANDSLLARRCANCDTTSTPLWRNGPRGPKSLCNACGIRFKKEERRATAANANSSTASGAMEQQYHQQHQSYNHHHNNNNPWVQVQHTQTQKMPCYSPSNNEFRFIDHDSDQNSGDNTGIPFLSWRLNVADRPSLVHDFTR